MAERIEGTIFSVTTNVYEKDRQKKLQLEGIDKPGLLDTWIYVEGSQNHHTFNDEPSMYDFLFKMIEDWAVVRREDNLGNFSIIGSELKVVFRCTKTVSSCIILEESKKKIMRKLENKYGVSS